MLFGDFPRLQDAKRWAKATNRNLQSVIEVDYYDSKKHAWRATEWLEGLPAKSLLIHEKKRSKVNLISKSVVFDTVFKTISKQHLTEIWVNRLVVIN